MTNLSGIVNQLKKEREIVEKQLSALNAAITAFVGAYSSPAKPSLSVAARKKISLAQKARRAKQKSNRRTGAEIVKRTMSPASRRKIAAAQRARWARVRAGQKAA